MSDDTLLVLSGIGVPDYSARGLTQTLEPIEASASLRRTVNGALMDLSYEQFRKYKSTVSCQDQEPPAVDGVWPGNVVTVDCVAELSYPASGSPARPVVTGSARTVGAFVFYRPRLEMRVMGFSVSRDEYGSVVSWQLQLEESDRGYQRIIPKPGMRGGRSKAAQLTTGSKEYGIKSRGNP